ncbi:FAD-binding oxidoreductase [Candidatus Saccharibacteria bacterium]|nr:FAD-binding oxidoreductase [Candidatus Saccharibacteria bacterium]
MNRIAIYLNQHIDGVAYSAPSILDDYTTDRSILKYHPRLVAVPVSVMDVRRLAKFSNQLATKKIPLPITMHGAGFSKTGSSIGSGLVVSTERLDRVQEIDVRQRLVRVQTGVTIGELRKALLLVGLELPIKGNDNETIGGLIAKNACAYDNTKPATIIDFVKQAEIVLADGTLIQTEKLNHFQLNRKLKLKGTEGDIYRKMNELISKNQSVIEGLPSCETNKAGYSGITRVKTKHEFDLLPLFCGSEGSLGIITEVILKVEPIFEDPNYIAIPCENAAQFVKASELLRSLKFTDIEFYDTELFNEAPNTGKSSKLFRRANDDGYLIIANAKDDVRRERRRKIRKLIKRLPKTMRVIEKNDENEEDFVAFNENLVAYLNDSGTNYHLPIIDGVYVPIDNQADFLNEVTKLARELKLALAVYGSVDFNTFTVRPSFVPSTSDGRRTLIMFMRRYLELIDKFGGHVCGAAPEGRFLAIFSRRYESAEALDLYSKIKDIFDPYGILNPGIKHEVEPTVVLRHFRTDYDQGIIPKE